MTSNPTSAGALRLAQTTLPANASSFKKFSAPLGAMAVVGRVLAVVAIVIGLALVWRHDAPAAHDVQSAQADAVRHVTLEPVLIEGKREYPAGDAVAAARRRNAAGSSLKAQENSVKLTGQRN